MANDESNKNPPPVEVEAVGEVRAPGFQKAEFKSQMTALLTLLVVFGLLWGLVKVMPTLGVKLQSGISTITSRGDEENESQVQKSAETGGNVKPEAEESAVAAKAPIGVPDGGLPDGGLPDGQTLSTAGPVVSVAAADGAIPEDKVKVQILEAIGGVERGEVRHIAFSDDLSKMIASLKVTPESGSATLIEVLFERDDFGRYISAENSPLATPITIWK